MSDYKSLVTYSLLVSGFVLEMLSSEILKGTSTIVHFLALQIGAVLFIWGCVRVAKSRGYRWYVGLWGLLNIIGLLVLFTFPPKAISISSAMPGSSATALTSVHDNEPPNPKIVFLARAGTAVLFPLGLALIAIAVVMYRAAGNFFLPLMIVAGLIGVFGAGVLIAAFALYRNQRKLANPEGRA